MDYKDIFKKAITTIKDRFVGEENTEELKERVRNLLSVAGMEIINVRGTVQKFEATVIVKIDSINNFIKCYCDQNTYTYTNQPFWNAVLVIFVFPNSRIGNFFFGWLGVSPTSAHFEIFFVLREPL